MKKLMIFAIVCALFPFAFFACKNFHRTVHNNTIYSSYTPRMEISVNPSLEYFAGLSDLQSLELGKRPSGTMSKRTAWWAFLESGECEDNWKFMKQALVIEIRELPPNINGIYTADTLGKIDHKIQQGAERILGKNYNWAIIGPVRMVRTNLAQLLNPSEYATGGHYVLKISVRKINQTSIIIIKQYEAIQGNQSFYDETKPLLDNGKFDDRFLTGFKDRCQSSLSFQKYTGNGLPPDLPQADLLK